MEFLLEDNKKKQIHRKSNNTNHNHPYVGGYWREYQRGEIYPENIIPRFLPLLENDDFLFNYNIPRPKFEWFLNEIITTDSHEFLHHFLMTNHLGVYTNLVSLISNLFPHYFQFSTLDKRKKIEKEIIKYVNDKHEDEVQTLEICIFQYLHKGIKPTAEQIKVLKSVLFK